MLPARDRITEIIVYPTKADAKANTNGTSYTEGIVEGTARLERTFYRALPAFGECNAAMFECELGINEDLTGRWIRTYTKAYATDSATSRTTYKLFVGKVDECKYDIVQATRKLVAYDEMYTLRNTDVSAWWNTYFANVTGNPGMGTVVGAMMTEFGVTGTAATTIGDSYVLFSSAQRSQLFSGCSFTQVLAYVGTARRMSFYINEDGELTACSYATVNKTNTPIALDGNIDTSQSTFGDDVNTEFSAVCIYDGTTLAFSDGNDSPTYSINDNPMLKGRNASQYATIGNGLLSAAKNMSGLRSAEIVFVVSSPDVVLFRPVAVSCNDVTYMASGVVLSGPQLIEQTVYCTNALNETPYYSSSVTSTNIVDNAISTQKIADGAVVTDKLDAFAVTAAKIAAGAITAEKINVSVDMATNAGVANTYATKSAAVNDSHQIYYKSNSATAPTAPTTWVTSSTSNNLTWSIKRMAADSENEYKYIYVCTQIKSVNGTITNSTVLLDDTTTVIDGGNIITGSIAANKVSVTDLTAFNAKIAGWSMESTRIYKEVTIGDYVYQVYMNAPATPVAGNLAVGIRKRPTNSQTWSYPCYFNYGGKFYATDGEVSGKITTGSGNIAGWNISSDSINADVTAYDPETASSTAEYHIALSPSANVLQTSNGDAGATITAAGVYTDKGALRRQSVTIGGTSHTAWRQSFGSLSMSAVLLEEKAKLISGSDNEYHTYRMVRAGNDNIKLYGERATFESDPTVNLEISVDDTTNTAKLTNSDLTFNGTSIFTSTAKVKQTATTTSASYPLLFGASSFTANQQVTTKTDEARISGGIFVNPNTATINARRIHSGTTSEYGRIVLGNAIASGTTGCSHGEIYIYGKGSTYVRIADADGVISANRTYRLPNQSGYLVVDAVTSGNLTGTSKVTADSCTWTKTGKMVRLSGTFYFNTSTSTGQLFSGAPVPASEMTINVIGMDNSGYTAEQLSVTTDGEIWFNSVGTHTVDQNSRFQFDTTYISAN